MDPGWLLFPAASAESAPGCVDSHRRGGGRCDRLARAAIRAQIAHRRRAGTPPKVDSISTAVEERLTILIALAPMIVALSLLIAIIGTGFGLSKRSEILGSLVRLCQAVAFLSAHGSVNRRRKQHAVGSTQQQIRL